MADNTLTRTQATLKKLERAQVREGHQKLLFMQLDIEGLPYPEPEYKFHPPRKWAIDFAWPDKKIALEVEGGVYTKQGGGHRGISGYDAGLEKYNQLAIDGWRLIRVTPEMLDERNGKAIAIIQQILRPYPQI